MPVSLCATLPLMSALGYGVLAAQGSFCNADESQRSMASSMSFWDPLGQIEQRVMEIWRTGLGLSSQGEHPERVPFGLPLSQTGRRDVFPLSILVFISSKSLALLGSPALVDSRAHGGVLCLLPVPLLRSSVPDGLQPEPPVHPAPGHPLLPALRQPRHAARPLHPGVHPAAGADRGLPGEGHSRAGQHSAQL